MISNGLMDTLQIVVLVLVAAGALVVVRTRDRARLVLVLSVYGILLAVLFFAFQAPGRGAVGDQRGGGGAAAHPAARHRQGEEARAVTPRQRLVLFSVAVAGLVGCYLWAFSGLPGFGNYPGPYGQAILAHAIAQTHATGVVSAINFEYRGFDTVGEEFILFTAAAGMSVVLRRLRNERKDPPEQLEAAAARDVPRTSPAVRGVALLLVAPTVVLGWWLGTHAQTNPSGGFQGGVILATAFMLVYLSGDLRTARRLRPEAVVDAAEAIGAGGFAAVGVTAVALGFPYLYNFLPLGKIPGSVSSSGTIALISLLVGIEVAAAFVAIIGELLEQSLIVRQPAPASGPGRQPQPDSQPQSGGTD